MWKYYLTKKLRKIIFFTVIQLCKSIRLYLFFGLKYTTPRYTRIDGTQYSNQSPPRNIIINFFNFLNWFKISTIVMRYYDAHIYCFHKKTVYFRTFSQMYSLNFPLFSLWRYSCILCLNLANSHLESVNQTRHRATQCMICHHEHTVSSVKYQKFSAVNIQRKTYILL